MEEKILETENKTAVINETGEKNKASEIIEKTEISETAEEIFRAENICYSNQGVQIIGGISMSLKKGEVAAMIGKSGSGKSTFLKILAGLILPTDGDIFYCGKKLGQLSHREFMEMRRKVAVVFQDSALWANQSIQQNLELPLKIHYPKMSKNEINAAVKEVCGKVNFERPLTLRPSDLSAGEQKKIAFARAIICKPEVLFLDECTDSLDVKGVEIIVKLLKDFLAQGNTMIYTSHDSDFISEFPGKVYYIKKGLMADEI